MDEKEIKWTAPEYEHFNKGADWHWLSVILAVLIIGVSLWQGNFLFAVFAVIAEIMIIIWGTREPNFVEFRVTKEGVAIHDHKFYQYADLSGFSMRRLDEISSELVLTKKGQFSPRIKLLCSTSDFERIKDFVHQHLPELDYQESLVEHLGKLMKF